VFVASFGYGSNKAVALARQRFDVPRALRIVVQDSPDLIDAEIDAPVKIHEGLVIPEDLPDFLAGDHLAGALRRQQQELEVLGLELYYPVHIEGIPCGSNEDTAIGNFFVQFSGSLCAYQVPGSALAMQFATCWNFEPGVSDGLGGYYLTGTFELTILEATGIYRSFQGGHNHMVDRLHQLADGNLDEYCFCFVSRR
jgi:hypothetical protein